MNPTKHRQKTKKTKSPVLKCVLRAGTRLTVLISLERQRRSGQLSIAFRTLHNARKILHGLKFETKKCERKKKKRFNLIITIRFTCKLMTKCVSFYVVRPKMSEKSSTRDSGDLPRARAALDGDGSGEGAGPCSPRNL